MCGLTGFWGEPGDAVRLEARALAMADALAHRGPDDRGGYADACAGFALGHRRLEVIDPGEGGRQPMATPDGRFVLAFNGEVYNFRELAPELTAEGVRLRGRSDTEVVLHALARWGVARALERFVGMFALALWDARERQLVLARDRLGIKPLTYGRGPHGGTLVFASESKALRLHPDFAHEVDRDALALYLRHGYVPTPHHLLKGYAKLRPGAWVRFRSPEDPGEEHRYWDLAEVARRGEEDPLHGGEEEAAAVLEEALAEAVRGRLVSDVPLGAFLSGGVDSSLVVAHARRASSSSLTTFTLGFREPAWDEAPYARRVAEHLGVRHVVRTVSAQDALEVLPRLSDVWDEPFADSSQIPTWLLSRLAAEHVTVCLSGDGGDELFGGYRRYFRARRTWGLVGPVPAPVRRAARAVLAGVPRGAWDALLLPARSAVERRLGARPGEALHKLASVLGAAGEGDFYRGVVSHWKEPARVVRASREPRATLESELPLRGFTARMMALDTLTYLPDDILHKVDRASMAHGLEVRVPLLDHRLVELAWRIPWELRVGARPGKRLLRACLARHVPPALFERPKQGFAVPLGPWLRGPLRGWAEELLRAQRLEEGGLEPGPVRALWERHQGGTVRGEHWLWDVLVYQAWRARWEPAHAEARA